MNPHFSKVHNTVIESYRTPLESDETKPWNFLSQSNIEPQNWNYLNCLQINVSWLQMKFQVIGMSVPNGLNRILEDVQWAIVCGLLAAVTRKSHGRFWNCTKADIYLCLRSPGFARLFAPVELSRPPRENSVEYGTSKVGRSSKATNSILRLLV